MFRSIRKIMSTVLAASLMVGTPVAVNTVSNAAGIKDVGSPDQSVIGDLQVELLASYNFDGNLKNAVTDVDATIIGNRLAAPVGTEMKFEDRDAENGKALVLEGGTADGLLLDVAPSTNSYLVGFDIKYNSEVKFAPAVLLAASMNADDALWASIGQGWQETLETSPMVWCNDVLGSKNWYDLVPTTTGTVKVGEWASVIFVADDTEGALFVNGVLVGEGEIADVISNSTEALVGVNAWDDTLDASIDNLYIMNVTAPAVTEPPVATEAPVVAVTGVTLDKTTAELEIGKSLNLKATVAPADATNTEVTWTSSNEKVATVSGGSVTAVAAGEATITATSVADNTKKAECKVTVKAAAAPVVSVSSVTLDKATADVTVGKTIDLVATINPSNATNQELVWTSSDETVATVVSGGTVTGVKAGTAKITVASKEDSTKTATCEVTVKAASTSLKKATITVKNGSKKVSKVNIKKGKKVTLKVSTTSNGTVKMTKLTKKQAKIAKVTFKKNKLTIKGKKKGSVSVKLTVAKTKKYKKATASVKVKVK